MKGTLVFIMYSCFFVVAAKLDGFLANEFTLVTQAPPVCAMKVPECLPFGLSFFPVVQRLKTCAFSNL